MRKLQELYVSNRVFKSVALVFGIFLFTSAYLSTLFFSLEDEFVLETSDEIDLYERLDMIYVLEKIDHNTNLPKKQQILNILLSEVDRVQIMEENSETLVPEVINYVRGDIDTLNLMLEVDTLEDELKNQLSDFNTFIKILEIQSPQEAEILMTLPDSTQKQLHDVIANSLINRIELPQQISMRYFISDYDIDTTLDSIKTYLGIANTILIISTVIAFITLLLLVLLGRLTGVLYAGIALIVTGGIIYLGSTWFMSELFVRLIPNVKSIDLITDFSKELWQSTLPFSYSYLGVGALAVLISRIFSKNKAR
ncbi:hypothetical protein [Natranaerobius trueperi]|uniref:Uncharacterized protein n=1 Tax=Natranaerobius trueperi TaxID=759412 RepID=A0A226BX48_9FIRM|nr:hypothetical protein [Natranaerobius trueperi]OWZ82710.1 hypothetical protein CDO51_12640 [Natranaerobius trueperi]